MMNLQGAILVTDKHEKYKAKRAQIERDAAENLTTILKKKKLEHEVELSAEKQRITKRKDCRADRRTIDDEELTWRYGC